MKNETKKQRNERIKIEAHAKIDTCRLSRELRITLPCVRNLVYEIFDAYESELERAEARNRTKKVVPRHLINITLAYNGSKGLKSFAHTVPPASTIEDLAKYVGVSPEEIHVADPEDRSLPVASLKAGNYLAEDETYLISGVTEEQMRRAQFSG